MYINQSNKQRNIKSYWKTTMFHVGCVDLISNDSYIITLFKFNLSWISTDGRRSFLFYWAFCLGKQKLVGCIVHSVMNVYLSHLKNSQTNHQIFWMQCSKSVSYSQSWTAYMAVKLKLWLSFAWAWAPAGGGDGEQRALCVQEATETTTQSDKCRPERHFITIGRPVERAKIRFWHALWEMWVLVIYLVLCLECLRYFHCAAP